MRNPFWLALLPIFVCLADVGLTLHGQPVEYWHGDYAAVVEGNPLPRFFMELHPLAFIVLVFVWVAAFTVIILFAPPRWALFACLAIIVGHSIGTASWLVRGRPFGPWFAALFLITVSVLTVPTWRVWRAGRAGRPTPSRAHEPE
jgi:hypothetical protein